MSVVGLTFGSGANAIRPSAASAARVATSAITRAVGCARSYQAKPARERDARGAANEARDPAHRPTSSAPAQQRGAALRVEQHRAAPPSTRAVWVAKYQPPPSTSAVGASATGRPSPSRIVRSAHAAANSASWVATSTAVAARRQLAQPGGEPGAVAAVHAARRLVEADDGGRLAGGEHELEREPLALAAGHVARVAVGERAGARRRRRRSRSCRK